MWWRRVVNNWQQRNTRATDSSCEHPLRTRLRSYSIASAGDDDISQFPPVPTSSVSRSPIGLVAVYATIIGIIVGAFIAGVAQLILFTERLVYGSDHQHEISPLDSLGPTINLLIHLVAVGFISGVGWAVLHWRSTRRVSIPQAMQGTTMPVGSTLSSSLLQIISVSAGVPIGREQAPRQIGALIASAFSRLWEVDRRTLRLLVASAAGAGMAASFHLPLAGALFTIELLLVSASVRAVVTTMTCSVVATTVSGLLGAPRVTYNAAQLNESALTLLCAVVVGAIAGLAGDYFARLAHRASARPVSARWQWLALTGVMAIVGVLSLFFLGSSGNGAYSANLALTARVTLGGAIAVFVIRLAVTCASFWAGAVGGILTPSFALGALLGCVLGYAGQWMFPSVDPRACALLGAAAFLSTTMAAPLFGLVAAVEFTNQGADGYLAMFVAVIAAALAVRATQKGQNWLFRRTVTPNKAGVATAQHGPFADDMRSQKAARPSRSTHTTEPGWHRVEKVTEDSPQDQGEHSPSASSTKAGPPSATPEGRTTRDRDPRS